MSACRRGHRPWLPWWAIQPRNVRQTHTCTWQGPCRVVRNAGGESLASESVVDRGLQVYRAVLLGIDRLGRKAPIVSADEEAIAAAEHAGVGFHRNTAEGTRHPTLYL